MLPGAGNVGQDILWQTRATCEMLVNTGGRKHTQRYPRCYGLCLTSYSHPGALECASEQENKDQIVHSILDGVIILCG